MGRGSLVYAFQCETNNILSTKRVGIFQPAELFFQLLPETGGWLSINRISDQDKQFRNVDELNFTINRIFRIELFRRNFFYDKLTMKADNRDSWGLLHI